VAHRLNNSDFVTQRSANAGRFCCLIALRLGIRPKDGNLGAKRHTGEDMNTAHKIKKLDGFQGEAELFRMEPPHEGYDYVVVSAITSRPTGMPEIDNIPGLLDSETYIFGANAEGEVVDWSDLPGSFKGAMDIPQALLNAGYVIKEAV
jgi:hypothetical protein